MIPPCEGASMATSGDIVRQGYLYIKRPPFGSRLRRLRTWQRYFVLLRDEFEEGKIALEFYNHERAAAHTETEAKGRGTTKVIELTGIAHVGRVSRAASQHEHCFTIVPDEEQPPLILACDDNMRMLEWISAVKLLSSKLVKPPEPVPRREPPSGEDRTERQSTADSQQQSSPLSSEGPSVMIRPKPDGASASRSPGKRRSYKVYVMPTELASTIKLTGVFRIRVTRRSVEVYSLYGGAPKLNLPLSCIKGYKVYPSAVEVDKILVLETARHSPAGQGIFQFRTAHCDSICDAIRLHTTEGEEGLVPIDVPEQGDGDEDDAPRSPTITLRNIDGLSSCSQLDSTENVATKEYAGKCSEDIACASFFAIGDDRASEGAETTKSVENSSDENGTPEEEAGYLTLFDTTAQDDSTTLSNQRIVPTINVNPAAAEGSKASSPVDTDLETQKEGEVSNTLIDPKKEEESCLPDPKAIEGDQHCHEGAPGNTKVLHDTEGNIQDTTKPLQNAASVVPSDTPPVDCESKNDAKKDDGCSGGNARSGGDGEQKEEQDKDGDKTTLESAADGTRQSVAPSDCPNVSIHMAGIDSVAETLTSPVGSQERIGQQVQGSEPEKEEKGLLCLPDATEESSSDELDTKEEVTDGDDIVSRGPSPACKGNDEKVLQEDKGSMNLTPTPNTSVKNQLASHTELKTSESEIEPKEEPGEDIPTPKVTIYQCPPAKSPIKLGPTTSLGAEKNAEDEAPVCRVTSLPAILPEVSGSDESPGRKTARQRDIAEDYEDIHPHGPLQRGIPLNDFVSPDAVCRPVASNLLSPTDCTKTTDDKTVAPGKRSELAEPPPLPPRTYKLRPG